MGGRADSRAAGERPNTGTKPGRTAARAGCGRTRLRADPDEETMETELEAVILMELPWLVTLLKSSGWKISVYFTNDML